MEKRDRKTEKHNEVVEGPQTLPKSAGWRSDPFLSLFLSPSYRPLEPSEPSPCPDPQGRPAAGPAAPHTAPRARQPARPGHRSPHLRRHRPGPRGSPRESQDQGAPTVSLRTHTQTSHLSKPGFRDSVHLSLHDRHVMRVWAQMPDGPDCRRNSNCNFDIIPPLCPLPYPSPCS